MSGQMTCLPTSLQRILTTTSTGGSQRLWGCDSARVGVSRRVHKCEQESSPESGQVAGSCRGPRPKVSISGVAEVATKGRKHRSLPRMALPLSTVEKQNFLSVVSSVVLLPTVRLRRFLALLLGLKGYEPCERIAALSTFSLHARPALTGCPPRTPQRLQVPPHAQYFSAK